jgi:hypothetical protein
MLTHSVAVHCVVSQNMVCQHVRSQYLVYSEGRTDAVTCRPEYVNVKVKQSRYMPWRRLGGEGV